MNKNCPSCGTPFNVSPQDEGKQFNCFKCNTALTVTRTGLHAVGSAPVVSLPKPPSSPVVNLPPVEEVQPAAAPVPAEVPPTALTEEEAKDFALFGAELYDAVARRDAIKLDPTVDRLKFRAQRDRLKGLGYRFDAAHQAWAFEEVAA